MWNEVMKEVQMQTSRSGGKGGQHVNKVETQVELRFNIDASLCFDEEQKEQIRLKLKHRINKMGLLILRCNEARTQFANRELAERKLIHLLETALVQRKKRVATRVSRAVKERRLDSKKKQGEKKMLRRTPVRFD